MSGNTDDDLRYYDSESLLDSSLANDVQRFQQRRIDRTTLRESRKPEGGSTDSEEYRDLVAAWMPKNAEERRNTLLGLLTQVSEPSAKTVRNTQETNQKNCHTVPSKPHKKTKHEEALQENLGKYQEPRSEGGGCAQLSDQEGACGNKFGLVRYLMPRRKEGCMNLPPDHKETQRNLSEDQERRSEGECAEPPDNKETHTKEPSKNKEAHTNEPRFVSYQEGKSEGGCAKPPKNKETHTNKLKFMRYQEGRSEGGCAQLSADHRENNLELVKYQESRIDSRSPPRRTCVGIGRCDLLLRSTTSSEGSLHRIFLYSPCPPALPAGFWRSFSVPDFATSNNALQWGVDARPPAWGGARNQRQRAARSPTENVLAFKIITSCVVVLAILAGGPVRVL